MREGMMIDNGGSQIKLPKSSRQLTRMLPQLRARGDVEAFKVLITAIEQMPNVESGIESLSSTLLEFSTTTPDAPRLLLEALYRAVSDSAAMGAKAGQVLVFLVAIEKFPPLMDTWTIGSQVLLASMRARDSGLVSRIARLLSRVVSCYPVDSNALMQDMVGLPLASTAIYYLWLEHNATAAICQHIVTLFWDTFSDREKKFIAGAIVSAVQSKKLRLDPTIADTISPFVAGDKLFALL